MLEPASLKVNHDPPKATTTTADPYNLDHYLLTSSEGFSPFEQTLGDAPFHDKNGDPIWAALAYTEDGGAHPGKAAPHLNPPIRLPLGGREYHLPAHSAYSILLPNDEYMEYVPVDDIPAGYAPIVAGCESDGLRKLYFATASVPRTFLDGLFGGTGDMIDVPGKYGEHLGGVMVAYGGREVLVKEGGSILCWKKKSPPSS